MCSFKTIFIRFFIETKIEIKCIYNSIYDIRNIYEIKNTREKCYKNYSFIPKTRINVSFCDVITRISKFQEPTLNL